MKKLIFALLLMAVSASAYCVSVTEKEGGCAVTGANYTAAVDNEGNLTSLVSGGFDFARTAGKIKGKVTVKDNSATVKTDMGSLIYTFGERKIEVRCLDQDFIFTVKAPVVRTPDMRYAPMPIPVDNFRKAAFLGGDACLICDGFIFHRTGLLANDDLIPLCVNHCTLTLREMTASERYELDRYIKTPAERYSELNVYTPQNYTVFQRKTKLDGAVKLIGSVHPGYDALKVRIAGKSLKGYIDRTINVPFDKFTGAFNEVADTPAGGWYSVTFTAYKDGVAVKSLNLAHVGVGEVFIGAGQSNSGNSAQYQIIQESGMVASFDGTYWRLANDPQLGIHDPNRKNGSFWPAFGDAMYKKYGVPIGVASTGHGGSSIAQWLPGAKAINDRGPMFDYTVNRMKQLGVGGFRAVLWHQGESNRGCDVDDAYNKMCRIIYSSYEAAGWRFPWFVAKVSYSPNQPNDEKIRSVHQRLWDNGVALEGPDTDVLVGCMRDFGGSGIHLSPQGLEEHGKMWCECVGKYLDKIL
ncbi:MAG: hypothetical protein J6U98_03020 [Abditibacteriota bacterium]|nr:hypothetical protein [Abditibacteriota bacterium]